jgi:hypothetical protein
MFCAQRYETFLYSANFFAFFLIKKEAFGGGGWQAFCFAMSGPNAPKQLLILSNPYGLTFFGSLFILFLFTPKGGGALF